MKKLLLNVAAVLVTVLGLGAAANMSPAAYADGVILCPGTTDEWQNSLAECSNLTNNNNKNNLMETLNTIINVVIGIIGFVAVAMMIMGGISFITSQGDTAKVTKARNTILYGVVGLVVAILAFAIVNFVLSSVFKAS